MSTEIENLTKMVVAEATRMGGRSSGSTGPTVEIEYCIDWGDGGWTAKVPVKPPGRRNRNVVARASTVENALRASLADVRAVAGRSPAARG